MGETNSRAGKLLAAISVLAVSLGMVEAATAEGTSQQIKGQSIQDKTQFLKGESLQDKHNQFLKYETLQQKQQNQIKYDSQHHKTNSQNFDTSTQLNPQPEPPKPTGSVTPH